MSEQMFHTPLEPHPSSSIYPPLFSGHKSDRHKDPSQDWVVYEEEPKLGYCDAKYVPVQGTMELYYSLYIPPHRCATMLYINPSTLYEHLQVT